MFLFVWPNKNKRKINFTMGKIDNFIEFEFITIQKRVLFLVPNTYWY